MKLLLDEMLSPAIARELQAKGHDVRAVSGDPDLEALSDPAVFDIAQPEKRAVVTNNIRDFRPLQNSDRAHFGMVFLHSDFRRAKADTGRIVKALDQLLRRTPDEAGLENTEWWLK